MRTAIRIIQVFVGLLFIISGLVKANDPLGLSYKMQEFFELWNSELAASGFFAKNGLMALFSFGHDQSLVLSVIMITLEVAAGIALLLAWKRTFILWLLLILILFFSFLTGYAYLSGKFTNCGCFGDCLPITPLTSFGKDILLLLLILVLLAGKKHVHSVLGEKWKTALFVSGTLLTLLLQWFVLRNLPLVDCLPFKKGNNISQQMKPPPGSVPDSFAIRFIYEKNGKQFEFAPEELPADFQTYKYIDRKDKLVRKGNAEPAVKGFSLSGISGQDSTQIILTQPNALLVFVLSFDHSLNDLKLLANEASQRGMPVYIASPSATEGARWAQASRINGLQFFNSDFTVVRTAARTNPTIYFLNNGTIKDKIAGSSIDDAIKTIQNIKP